MVNVVMAMSKLESRLEGANDIEALAAPRGLRMICNIGAREIILEGDSLWTIEALKSSSSLMRLKFC